MTKKTKPNLNQRHTGTSSQIWGWAVSIGIHILLALAFILFSGSQPPSADTHRVPTSRIFEPPEPLQHEPIVEDLQIEFQTTEPLSQELEPLPMPDLQPMITEQHGVPLAVAGGDGSGEFVVPQAARANTLSHSFCDLASDARRICYVVDCSGSMVVAFEYVRQELQAALRQLSPAHYFQIILYAGAQPSSLEQGRLLRATRQNIGRALDFTKTIELRNVDTADAAAQSVLAALEMAFAIQTNEGSRPDLVYLLTDGEFDHNVVTAAAHALQKRFDPAPRVHVIGCGNAENKSALQNLARLHHGRFKFVTTEQLDAAIKSRP